MTDAELHQRGVATLLAAWETYARGCPGATVLRHEGLAAAVFPDGPERHVYNNAVLEADVVDVMEEAYAQAGVERFAAWIHDSDTALLGALASRGYGVAETTRIMARDLAGLPWRPEAELGPLDWSGYRAYLEAAGAPRGLLAGADPHRFHVLAARDGDAVVATAIAFDHEGDCGIFNMSTAETARRRGLATALTARHLHDAAERGCATASLQATPMAERIYAAAGFRDLGRFLELVPADGDPPLAA